MTNPTPDEDLVVKSTTAPSESLCKHLAPAVPTVVYNTYWRFAAERQRIFFRKLRGEPPPWTSDPILQRYKFTNAYRASDRVSQYLIRHVLEPGRHSSANILFRILLFKFFNRISTWQFLERHLGEIHLSNISLTAIDKLLTQLLTNGTPVYSAAYIIPSPQNYGAQQKHRNQLSLLEEMLADGLHIRIDNATSMAEVYELLRSYPSIGPFLGYQYSIDINYSALTDFSEMEFVVPGPGATSGIDKCFDALGGLTEADIIHLMADRQNQEFDRLGLDFLSLWGRPLQLVDCQNLFCEVDKYSRLAHPEIQSEADRTEIKQRYSPSREPIEYKYPSGWDIGADTNDPPI